ncbi:hypothetical protein ACFFRR_005956 [Megaselia abdita]
MEFPFQTQAVKIFFTMEVSSVKPSTNSMNSIKDLSLENLSQDLTRLFEDSDLSDITIFCKGHEYKAHRAILAYRCPVFKAISKQTRNSAHSIVFDDMDPKAFEVFVHRTSHD